MAGAGGDLDPALEAYASSLAGRLLGVLGPDLVGVYLHGSAVLGGWRAEVSDVDLLGVVTGPLPEPAKQAVAERLTDPALPCPAAHGLELSLITAATAGSPARLPPFELHVAFAPGTRRHREGFPVNLPRTKVVDGSGQAGDPDLLLYVAVCRRSGRAVLGPPPAVVFAEPPRSWLLEATAAELRWAAGRATFAYQVLTACRAWRFLEDDVLASKVAAGAWARTRLAAAAPDLTDLTGLVDLALAAQRGEIPMPVDPALLAAADQFLKRVMDR
jgi:Domain of unknown function (DUF4111)